MTENQRMHVLKICLLIPVFVVVVIFYFLFFFLLAFSLPDCFLTPPILTLPTSFIFANALSSYLAPVGTAPLGWLIQAALWLI